MKKRNYPKSEPVQKIKRERDPIPWRYCLLTLVCGLLLVGGFFFAAKQHFAAIDFGIKNSRLKKQLENLEDDKRRLLLDKELAVSPAEITRAAKKLGITALSGTMSFVGGDQTNAKIDNNSTDTDKDKKPDGAKNIQPVNAKPKNDAPVKTAKIETAPKSDRKAEKPPERAIDKRGNKL